MLPSQHRMSDQHPANINTTCKRRCQPVAALSPAPDRLRNARLNVGQNVTEKYVRGKKVESQE